MKKQIRIGIVIDFPEERWESMDLVAEMTLIHLEKGPYSYIKADVITPLYRKIFQAVFTQKKWAWNLDRLINRRIVLKNGVLRSLKSKPYDVVYIVDHSYAHLVNTIKKSYSDMPVVIMCHDLDAVSLLNQPYYGMNLTNRLLRYFARPILNGLLKSDWIITGSDTVRDALIHNYPSRFQPSRIMTNPYGIAEEFQTKQDPVRSGPPESTHPIVLHVGSVIPRKRIDVLLMAVAGMAEMYENLVLVRIGGDFSVEQKVMAKSLGLENRIHVMPRLTRLEVADWYRKSDVVLITSEAEGFGLPVIEALACGASVVASDIAVLRETGGKFVKYAPVGDSGAFAKIASEVMGEAGAGQGASDGLRLHLKRYQWPVHLDRLVEVLVREAGLRPNERDGE